MSAVSAALLLVATALMAASATASYECLEREQHRQCFSAPGHPAWPGSAHARLHRVQALLQLRDPVVPQAGSTVYMTVAKPGNCERVKALIVRAAEDPETPRKDLSHCLRLDTWQVRQRRFCRHYFQE
uniref:NTR domain-containing protein n=1 Tax=Macrostomum lignano TaxID=282301 RepID=A0A1I8F321_9PLAT